MLGIGNSEDVACLADSARLAATGAHIESGVGPAYRAEKAMLNIVLSDKAPRDCVVVVYCEYGGDDRVLHRNDRHQNSGMCRCQRCSDHTQFQKSAYHSLHDTPSAQIVPPDLSSSGVRLYRFAALDDKVHSED